MVKIALLIASAIAFATSVMTSGSENAVPTAAPTLVARGNYDDIDTIFSSHFNDPEGIQKHLSRASERLNNVPMPSAARESAQSRIAEASRSIGAIRPTDKDGKTKETATPTPSGTGTSPIASPTGNAVAAADATNDNKSSAGITNKPIGALAAAIAAAVAVNALM